MQQDCPFGVFPPFEVPPTNCCWDILSPSRPRVQLSQTLLRCRYRLPPPHWCSTGKISPAPFLGLKRTLKDSLYHRDSAKQSQKTSSYLEPLRRLLRYCHWYFQLKVGQVGPAHFREGCFHWWPQLCLSQMNPVSHWLPKLPSCQLQPGNEQSSERLPLHSQTLPGLLCCPEHTWQGVKRQHRSDPRACSRSISGTLLSEINLHVQCTLGLDCFLLAAIANQSTALGQTKVESQQGTVLHTDSPQSGTINLNGNNITIMSKH